MAIQAAVISMPKTTYYVRPQPANSVMSAPTTADAPAPAAETESNVPAHDPNTCNETAVDECSICLSEFVAGEQTKRLPCACVCTTASLPPVSFPRAPSPSSVTPNLG